jgi:hypothetical protein
MNVEFIYELVSFFRSWYNLTSTHMLYAQSGINIRSIMQMDDGTILVDADSHPQILTLRLG